MEDNGNTIVVDTQVLIEGNNYVVRGLDVAFLRTDVAEALFLLAVPTRWQSTRLSRPAVPCYKDPRGLVNPP